MTEIRSYRRVFDLERRVYSIDSLRLNPGGVPVRGIVYFVAILVGGLLVARLPLLGPLATALPWFVRYLALPGASATVLALVRLEGRTFHLAAAALARYWIAPRRLAGLRCCEEIGRRWYPQEILVVPDGSEARMRRMRYTGPGAVLVAVEHERRAKSARASLTLIQRPHGGTLERAQVILLGPGARMRVRATRAEGGTR